MTDDGHQAPSPQFGESAVAVLTGRRAARPDEGAEQGRVAIEAGQPLGMPLDAQDEAAVDAPGRLDRPVGCPGRRAQALAHLAHGLVMERVDLEDSVADDLLQQRPRRDDDRVRRDAGCHRLAMRHDVADGIGDVLMESASAGDADLLRARGSHMTAGQRSRVASVPVSSVDGGFGRLDLAGRGGPLGVDHELFDVQAAHVELADRQSVDAGPPDRQSPDRQGAAGAGAKGQRRHRRGSADGGAAEVHAGHPDRYGVHQPARTSSLDREHGGKTPSGRTGGARRAAMAAGTDGRDCDGRRRIYAD